MLEKFDIWLLESVFEKFSHWWQKNINGDQDCFWWAKVFCISYAVICFSFACLLTFFAKNVGYYWGAAVYIFESVFPSLQLWNLISYIQRDTYRHIKQYCANPYKLDRSRMLLFSVPELLVLPLFLFNIFHLFLWFFLPICAGICAVCSGYFNNCDPLPPAKSRLKKWIDKLVLKTKEILSPEPQPVPIRAFSK